MSDKKNYIPVVDIAPLFSDNPADWTPVDQAIGQACVEAGAFLADGIPKPVKPDSEQTRKLLAFYDLPLAQRLQVGMQRVNPDNTRRYRGYANHKVNDWVRTELYDIGPKYDVTGPDIPEVDQLIETNAWPETEPKAGWQGEMERYYGHMHDFSHRLIRAIIRYIGADETSGAARFDDSNSTLRLLNYPALPEGRSIEDDPESLREWNGQKMRLMISEHRDQCCLSLLWQSDAGGLQMKSPAGHWQAVPLVENGVSVHIGLAMESMTAGQLSATPHRVLGKGNARQSIGFFFEPNLHSSVRSLHEAQARPDDVQDTYAAALLRTFAERQARREAEEAAKKAAG